jgi:cation diffusion facilitator family transporter
VSSEGGARAVVAALASNLGIGATKFVAFALTGSAAMLAESIHSVADSGNQALLLVGAKKARREATEEHPFGFSRAQYYYAFLVAVVLFSVGGLYALYESWQKFGHPEPIVAVAPDRGARRRGHPRVALVSHGRSRVKPRARQARVDRLHSPLP